MLSLSSILIITPVIPVSPTLTSCVQLENCFTSTTLISESRYSSAFASCGGDAVWWFVFADGGADVVVRS